MSKFDEKDRLILALCALLRAERETRSAFEAVIAKDGVSREVLKAILADPIPVVTRDDLRDAEELVKVGPPPLMREAA